MKKCSLTVRRVQEATIVIEVPEDIDTTTYNDKLTEFAVQAVEKSPDAQWCDVEDSVLEYFGEVVK